LGQPETEGDIGRAVHAAKPDAILHFAANALVGESMTNPKKYFHNNVVNALQLADAAVACGVKKFVFSSTCATYGPPDRLPITEDAPQRPINPYGESKLMFEKILQWYRQIHGLEFVAFRYFNAAGASEQFGEHHRIETHLIPNILKVPLGQAARCEIYGTDYPTPDGTCIRDYIHIADLAQAHILGLAPGATGFYNLGNGDGYSVRQVISTCERITGRTIPVVEKPRRPGDPPRLVASAAKAIRDLGWKPRFPKLEDIVATAWRWHTKNPYGYREEDFTKMAAATKRILLVDDDPIIPVAYRAKLLEAGFQVDIALDGLVALKLLHATPPDVVVLDVMMPKFSGLEVLKFLHSQEALKDIRVIILSNMPFGDAERKVASTEADKTLLKSECTPALLLAAVNEVLAVPTHKSAAESPNRLAEDIKHRFLS
jgi:UDP-glucose 4-epimerase